MVMSKTNTERLNRLIYDVMDRTYGAILLESCTASVKTECFVSSQMLRRPAVQEKYFVDIFKKFLETSKIIFFPSFYP